MSAVLDKKQKRLATGDKIAPQTRSMQLKYAAPAEGEQRTVEGLDKDARTLTMSFSSEAPVMRWFGNEVLSHEDGCADFTRLNSGAPLLFNHNRDDILGVVEKAWVDNKRGYATVRFGKDARGDWAMAQAEDGILCNASFMYQASEYTAEDVDPSGYDSDDATYTAQRWMAYEVSLVSVPADQSVGVGRAAGLPEQTVMVRSAAPEPEATPAATAATPTPGEDPMKFRNDHLLMNAAVAGLAAGATGADGGGGGAAAPDPVAVERQRTADIVALGRAHKLEFEQVQSMLQRGLDIGEARGEVLANILQRGQSAVAGLSNGNNPDLTEKEKRSWSLIKAVRAACDKDWTNAGFEREVSDAIAKASGRASTGGFFMPTNLPFAPSEDHMRAWNLMNGRSQQVRAPYLVGTAGQGGNLVATNLLADQWIEVLRNMLVTTALGARYLTGLVGKVDIPRQITQTGAYWVGESAAPTESEATFDKVSLSPKTIGAMSKMSRLMLLQGTPAIEMIAREDLMAVMALGIDLAALSGSGTSNQPTGIVNQSGVSSVVGGTNGANLSFDNIIQMQYATKFANAPQGSAGYALNSKAIGYLSTLKASTGQYLWDPQGGLTNASPDKLKGRVYAESQQLRSTLTKGTATSICSELIYGNWRELLIAEWGVTEIVVNPYGTTTTEFGAGDVWIRALQSMDIGVRHGASFAVMSDALTPGF